MKTSTLNPNKQKKRLRWILLLFFIVLALPVYYLLQTVYTQLENEAYFTARHQAEKLVDQIELNLQHLLETEQNRPIAEYSFFNVLENPLLSESSGVKFSPLSEVPPKTDIKGVVGYFQINTDGSFHLPALPALGQDNISGLSLAELENRLALKEKLRQLLSIKIADKIDPQPIKQDSLAESKIQKWNQKPETQPQQSYMDEFKQQNIARDVMRSKPEVLELKKQASSNQIQSYETKSKRLRQALPLSKTAKKYRTRKEIVQLPDQTMASSYFKQPKEQAGFAIAEQESLDIAEKDTSPEKSKSTDSIINILSFESEVTPKKK